MNRTLSILAGLVTALLATSAVAQKYPERPVRVILGVPTGGTPDLLARTVIPGLSERLGQSLVVDNRGGAGGRIGAELAANAAPDGYTLFMTSPGAQFTHVPYKGAPAAVIDLLAGRVGATMNSIGPVLAHLKSGKLRALGVAGSKRSPTLPDLPTIAEAGVPGYESGSWMGLLAPAKTPQRIIAQVSDAAVKTVRSQDVHARLESLGAVPVGDTPKEFAARIKREYEQSAKVVKTAGVRIE